MDSLLKINKLLDFAIQLEDMGELFFTLWAQKSDSHELKKFFQFLAEEESGHKKTFLELKQKVAAGEVDLPETPEDFDDHFKEFADTILYNDKEMKDIKNLAEAIELAKKQELDAQLFFSDLIQYIPEEYVAAVKQIIIEESDHFKKLQKLQKKLFKPNAQV